MQVCTCAEHTRILKPTSVTERRTAASRSHGRHSRIGFATIVVDLDRQILLKCKDYGSSNRCSCTGTV